MILRHAAVRHGRRALASPIPRSALRQLSTETTTGTDSQSKEPGSDAVDLSSERARSTLPETVTSASTKKKQRALQDVITSLGASSGHEHRGAAWSKPHKLGDSAEELTAAQQFSEFNRIQKSTRSIGSRVERRYIPAELINNPPGPEDVTLELLMASQTHMGHNKSLWNPANSRYIYGVRQGIHIISLETTAAHLRRAARVVEDVSYRGGVILFVGTRKGQMEIVTKAAEMAGACHLFTKWIPGAITNRDLILKTRGSKVVDQFDKELDGFDRYRGSARPLMPDMVVCLNPLENYTLLYECGLKNIPTIGVIDTNADPSWVTYTIPANDDSLRAMAVVAGVLGRSAQTGKKRRLEDSAKGQVTWGTPRDIDQYMGDAKWSAVKKRKEVMGQMQQNIQGFTEEEQQLMNAQLSGGALEVGQEEMLEMLGAAAMGEAEGEAAGAQEQQTEGAVAAQMGHIEAELEHVKQETAEIETGLAESEKRD